MDLVKLKAEKQEREKQLKLIREAALRSKILAEEEAQRLVQLNESSKIIQANDRKFLEFLEEEGVCQSWTNVLNCSRLPDLSQLSTINTFFSEWCQLCDKGDIRLQNVFEETPGILDLVKKIKSFLDFPPDHVPVQNLIEMGITYHQIKKRQQEFIDRGSYRILTDLRALYDPEVGLIEFETKISEAALHLWANLYSCPDYAGHFFEDAHFRFRIPEALVLLPGAYRLVKSEYDPYSDSTNSYFPPAAPSAPAKSSTIQNWIWRKSLLSISKSWAGAQVAGDEEAEAGDEGAGVIGLEAVNAQESKAFLLKRKWKSMTMRNQALAEERGKSSGGSEALEQTVKAPTISHDDKDTPMSPTPQVINSTQEEGREGAGPAEATSAKTQKKGRRGKDDPKEGRTKTEAELAKERERKEKAVFIPKGLRSNELNLRSHRILGGIYDFKLLQIPPQPIDPGRDDCWTLHDIENLEDGGQDYALREVAFLADYFAPPTSDLNEVKRTPEEMEREAKRQEEELQKLLLVEIKVPKTALWFEPPTIVRWDKEDQLWATDGFFDPRFNEDSLQLSFRMTRFGVIGLGHNRWSNLPYQSWELRPNGSNSVILSLMAAVAVLEFTVKNDLVCLSSLQNVGNSDLVEAALIGNYMKPTDLIQELRHYGLDVFPEIDSYAYVDGILVKYPESEEHLYQCMALISPVFNCHWSRWNLLAGRNKMIYQVRERHGTATPGNYQMVLNTSRSVSLIDCTEVSPNYSEETVGDYQYQADLLQLARSMASDEAQEIMDSASGEFIETVRLLLASIKFLSFA